MTLQSEIVAQYRDQNYLVSPYLEFDVEKAWASGNGLVYTAYYLALLQARGELTDEVQVLAACGVFTCRKAGYPGLYTRAAGHPDQEGPDDYIGLSAIAALASRPEIAKEIIQYGQAPVLLKGVLAGSQYDKFSEIGDALFGNIAVTYNYNNVVPGTMHRSSWLGRQPQVIASLEWAAGLSPPLWRRLYWFVVVCASGSKTSRTQDWMLSWLLIVVAGDKTWLNRLASAIWWRRLKRNVGSLQTVFQSYFGPEHPITKYCNI